MAIILVNTDLDWLSWKLLSNISMTIKTITYKINFAKKRAILNHLRNCNASFVPPLNHKVDIDNYSQKIFNNADTFEAWNKNKLVGLVAVYCNEINKRAFITNVSVLEKFNNMGVASKLLENCIKYIESKQFKEIALEVNMRSDKAKSLYKKLDFQEVELDNETILMRYKI